MTESNLYFLLSTWEVKENIQQQPAALLPIRDRNLHLYVANRFLLESKALLLPASYKLKDSKSSSSKFRIIMMYCYNIYFSYLNAVREMEKRKLNKLKPASQQLAGTTEKRESWFPFVVSVV